MEPVIPQFSLVRQHELLRDELRHAATESIESGQYIGGRDVEMFEELFANRVGTRWAVGVASGTDGLILALQAIGVGPGDSVIAPGFTFIASATAATHLGATVVLADVSEVTCNVTPQTVRDAFELASESGLKPKAVIVVHLYGLPADVVGIQDVCEQHGAVMIEDCAQSFGAKIDGRMTGSFGAMGVFSFFPTKPLGALGDGGAIASSSSELVDTLRLLRTHGSSVKYQHETLGRNSRLDALQARFLQVKLKHIDWFLGNRARIAGRYDAALGWGLEMLAPVVPDGVTPSWGQYTVRIPHDRDRVRRVLAEVGIDATVHYPLAVHEQPLWEIHLQAAIGQPLTAAKLARQVLCLPIFPELTDNEGDTVAHALNEAIAEVTYA